METQYFIYNEIKFIVSPDSLVPGDLTLREYLGLTDTQYNSAIAEWNASANPPVLSTTQ